MTYEDFIRNDADVVKKDHVDIVAYDPEWPIKAGIEINKLREVLPILKTIIYL